MCSQDLSNINLFSHFIIHNNPIISFNAKCPSADILLLNSLYESCLYIANQNASYKFCISPVLRVAMLQLLSLDPQSSLPNGSHQPMEHLHLQDWQCRQPHILSWVCRHPQEPKLLHSHMHSNFLHLPEEPTK